MIMFCILCSTWMIVHRYLFPQVSQVAFPIGFWKIHIVLHSGISRIPYLVGQWESWWGFCRGKEKAKRQPHFLLDPRSGFERRFTDSPLAPPVCRSQQEFSQRQQAAHLCKQFRTDFLPAPLACRSWRGVSPMHHFPPLSVAQLVGGINSLLAQDRSQNSAP